MSDGFAPEWPEPLLCGKEPWGFCGCGRGREWVAIHREWQELPEGVGGDALIEGSFVGGRPGLCAAAVVGSWTTPKGRAYATEAPLW